MSNPQRASQGNKVAFLHSNRGRTIAKSLGRVALQELREEIPARRGQVLLRHGYVFFFNHAVPSQSNQPRHSQSVQ